MTPRSRLALLVAAAGVVLASCSTATRLAYSNAALAYSNLASMATWMVDDYVDLDGRQKDWVRERLSRVMAWHRAQELPRYRQFLEHALKESAEPFTAEEIADAYDDLRAHYRRMVEHLLPDVADFFLQLDADQVAQMAKKFEDDNRRFVRESVKGTPEDRLERRVDRFANHLDAWLGEVTREQRALIARHYRGMDDFIEERLADRKYRQSETLVLIRAHRGKPEMVAGLRRLLVESDGWRRPEYRQQLKDRDRRMFTLIADLSATLSPRQRAHLQERIRQYLRDIGSLAVPHAGNAITPAS